MSRPSEKYQSASSDILGQKVGNKITNIGKIAISMEGSAADLLEFFTEKLRNLIFGSTTDFLEMSFGTHEATCTVFSW